MATKRTPAQRAQLTKVNRDKGALTRKYAFRMHKWLSKWKAEGYSQRSIVLLLNSAGAPVPSEYNGESFQPQPIKQWTLTQYQRFQQASNEAYERMVWWSKRRGRASLPAYGDGAGLFKHPLQVMEQNPNHERHWGTAEWKAWSEANPLDQRTLERLRRYQETGELPGSADDGRDTPEVAFRRWLLQEAAKPQRQVDPHHPALRLPRHPAERTPIKTRPKLAIGGKKAPDYE